MLISYTTSALASIVWLFIVSSSGSNLVRVSIDDTLLSVACTVLGHYRYAAVFRCALCMNLYSQDRKCCPCIDTCTSDNAKPV